MPGVVLQLRAGTWSHVASPGGREASADMADTVVRSDRECYRCGRCAGIVVLHGNLSLQLNYTTNTLLIYDLPFPLGLLCVYCVYGFLSWLSGR